MPIINRKRPESTETKPLPPAPDSIPSPTPEVESPTWKKNAFIVLTISMLLPLAGYYGFTVVSTQSGVVDLNQADENKELDISNHENLLTETVRIKCNIIKDDIKHASDIKVEIETLKINLTEAKNQESIANIGLFEAALHLQEDKLNVIQKNMVDTLVELADFKVKNESLIFNELDRIIQDLRQKDNLDLASNIENLKDAIKNLPSNQDAKSFFQELIFHIT